MNELQLKELDIRDDFVLHAEMCETYAATLERVRALQAEDAELKDRRQGKRIKARRAEIAEEIAFLQAENVEPVLASHLRNVMLGKMCRTIEVADAEIDKVLEMVRKDPVHYLGYRTDDLVTSGLKRAYYTHLRDSLAKVPLQEWSEVIDRFYAQAVMKVLRGAESRVSRSTSQQSNLIDDIELEWFARLMSRPTRWTTFSEIVWEWNRCAKNTIVFDDVSGTVEDREDDWEALSSYR